MEIAVTILIVVFFISFAVHALTKAGTGEKSSSKQDNDAETKNDNDFLSANYNSSTTSIFKSNDDTSINIINPSSGAFMNSGIGGLDTFGNSFGNSMSGGFNND
jgi:hypothetical protein